MSAHPINIIIIDLVNQFLYNISILVYRWFVGFLSPFSDKAKKAHEGRKQWRQKLTAWRNQHTGELVWFHCASLGEFEQGRPLIEAIKKTHPTWKILLTFFSPSGYEIRKNYSEVDGVFYLPFDTPRASADFVSILRPDKVIFVKYEFWVNFFNTLKAQNIPLYMISVIFREDQRFFKINKNFWKKTLDCVEFYFLQNEKSLTLLRTVSDRPALVTGDTRFDRVLQISRNASSFDKIEEFIQSRSCVIVGSAYVFEDRIIQQVMHQETDCCFIIAPHEINEERIHQIEKRFSKDAIRYSLWNGSKTSARVLILDTMGMLSSVYQYGEIALIGGGFGKGIHNTLEAAVYGIPLVFGPNYEKFEEAKLLLKSGGAKTVNSEEAASSQLLFWLKEKSKRELAGKAALEVVETGAGSVAKILKTLVNQ